MRALSRPSFLGLCLALAVGALAALLPWSTQASAVPGTLEVCFTPGMDCEGYIVSLIDQTQHDLYIQAYSFTSAPIAKAVIRAAQRGVQVAILLDHSQWTEKYSSATFFVNAGLTVMIDDKEAIAHNKVMVLDRARILTGSFNFTKAAQQHNAENLVSITEAPDLVRQYLANFDRHWSHAVPYGR